MIFCGYNLESKQGESANGHGENEMTARNRKLMEVNEVSG